MRNFLRPFRGVHKKYLHQYVAMFEWSSNAKRVTTTFIQAILGVRDAGRVFTDAFMNPDRQALQRDYLKAASHPG